MLARIKQWLEPPHFEGDEEKTNRTRIANTLIIYLGAAVLIVMFILVPLFAFQKTGAWMLSIMILCALGIGRHFIFKGNFRLGATLIFSVIYLCILAMLILSGGSSGTAMFYFATAVLIAGFFLDARIVNGLSFSTFLIALGISFLQERGLITIPRIFLFNSVFSWLATGVGLLIVTRSRDLFMSYLENALTLTRQQITARQDAETIFQRIVETTNEGVIVLDIEARITWINRQVADMLGYPFEGILGQKLESFFFEEDLADHHSQMRSRAEGKSTVYERCFRRKDGEKLWTLISATATTDAAGNFNGAFGMITNITERKSAEEALRESEARYRTLFEQASDGIFYLSTDGKVLAVNQSFARMHGYSVEEMQGMDLQELDLPENTQLMPERMRQVMEGKIIEFEVKHYHKDGHTFPLAVSSGMISVGGQDLIQAFHRDITEHKRTEEALWQQNQFLIALQNTTLELVSQLDLRTLLENIVKRACALVGTSAGMLDLIDPATDQLIPQVGVGALKESLRLPVQPGEGLTGIVWQTGEILVVPDYDEWTGRLDKFSRSVLGSVIGVPLLSGEKVLGVLVTGSAYGVPHQFDPAAIEILNQFARLATVAVQNARLFSDLQAELTERRRIEEALRASEERYKLMFESAPLAINITRGTDITYANPSYLKMFGYSSLAELQSVAPLDLFTAESRPQILENIQRRTQGLPVPSQYEAECHRKNGARFPILMNFSRTTFADGEATVGFIIDITSRKRAENALRESEARAQAMFRAIPDLMFRLTREGVYLDYKADVENLFIQTKSGIIGKNNRDLTPPEFADLIDKFIQITLKTKTLQTFVYHMPIPGRGEADYEARMVASGRDEVTMIVRDITERKQREDELQAIATLSTALRSASTRTEMLPVIVKQLVLLLKSDTASVEIVDPLTGDAVLEGAYGAWEALIGTRQPNGTGINAIISKTRQPYTTNDLKNDPNVAYPESSCERILGAIGAPLIAQGQVIGYIWTGRRTKIFESEIRLLVAVADIAANAIHRSTLHEQTLKDATDLAEAYNSTLEGWAHALELRDYETEGHTRRVAQMTIDLARDLGVGEGELENIRRGALLHDIGKMGIPDAILLKTDALDESEWELMKQHPIFAHKLLEPIEYLHPVLGIPYCHHERWDGSGYPRGLQGEEIPLEARVFAIVDVWDALTSDRPYRPAWSKETALNYIIEQSGQQFDPVVVKAFLKSVY